jgi:hypothetical protein
MNIKDKVSGLWLAGLLMTSNVVGAADVFLSNSVDPTSGVVEIDLSIYPPPTSVSEFKFILNYNGDSASFTKAIFANATVTSYASSKTGASGQVNGGAFVDFRKGASAVKLYFSTQSTGILTGIFQSISVDDNEMGPIPLSSIAFNGSMPPAATSAPVAPKDIIVSAMNQALAIDWFHPDDNVSGFRAEAWLLQNNGQAMGSVALCDATGTERQCIISGLQNGRSYKVTISSIYPDGTFLSSAFSDPSIPSSRNVNGLCPSTPLTSPREADLRSESLCLKGKLAAYSFDGVSAHWSCVGLGHGETQACRSP